MLDRPSSVSTSPAPTLEIVDVPAAEWATDERRRRLEKAWTRQGYHVVAFRRGPDPGTTQVILSVQRR